VKNKRQFSYLISTVHSDLIFCLSSYRRRWRGGALGAAYIDLVRGARGCAAAKTCPYCCGHARTRRRPTMDSAALRGRRVAVPWTLASPLQRHCADLTIESLSVHCSATLHSDCAYRRRLSSTSKPLHRSVMNSSCGDNRELVQY